MRRLLIWVLRTAAALLAAVALGAGWLYWRYEPELPDHRILLSRMAWGPHCQIPEEPQEFAPLGSIPAHVVNAFVAKEDPMFYKRPPFSAWSFFRWLARADLNNRGMDWASGFTKYAMKNLSCGKDLDRRFFPYLTKSLLLAYRIERDISKDVLVERYVNLTLVARRRRGPTEVAQLFFHKRLEDVTLAEAALMANASMLHLGVWKGQMKGVIRRRNIVLDRMARAGFITAAQAEEAGKEPLTLQEPPSQKR